MDQRHGARVPFDARLHLPAMVQTSYTADHYHAMKKLVSEGYITIKPNAKLRLGPSGLWEADGQSPLAETISREESPVEPHISAETVNPRTSLEPNCSHDNWNSDPIGEKEANQVLRLIDEAKEMLKTKHDNAHPAWAKLQEQLERSSSRNWTEEALKSAIIQANKEESEDVNAFIATYAYCLGSRRPNIRCVAAANALMKALYHFCGCHAPEYSFSEKILGADEGDEDVEARRKNALKLAAQTRDPPNATAIISYVEMVQTARGFDHGLQSIFTAMEGLYDHLNAMIEERKLGDRMMRLISL